MSSYKEELQRFWHLYRDAGHSESPTAKEVASWAYDAGLWKPRASDIVDVLAEDLARAWREEYATDSKGRRYRKKHPRRVERDGKQLYLWEDLETAPREHMELAFAQRRQQIVGDCIQLSIDVDVYNGRNRDKEPIQIVLDFEDDVNEHFLSTESEIAA
jgi:hypothetical protein